MNATARALAALLLVVGASSCSSGSSGDADPDLSAPEAGDDDRPEADVSGSDDLRGRLPGSCEELNAGPVASLAGPQFTSFTDTTAFQSPETVLSCFTEGIVARNEETLSMLNIAVDRVFATDDGDFGSLNEVAEWIANKPSGSAVTQPDGSLLGTYETDLGESVWISVDEIDGFFLVLNAGGLFLPVEIRDDLRIVVMLELGLSELVTTPGWGGESHDSLGDLTLPDQETAAAAVSSEEWITKFADILNVSPEAVSPSGVLVPPGSPYGHLTMTIEGYGAVQMGISPGSISSYFAEIRSWARVLPVSDDRVPAAIVEIAPDRLRYVIHPDAPSPQYGVAVEDDSRIAWATHRTSSDVNVDPELRLKTVEELIALVPELAS